jgi:hypothetical protein
MPPAPLGWPVSRSRRPFSSILRTTERGIDGARHRSAIYHVVVENAAGTGRGVRSVTVGAHAVPDGEILLMDDGKTREVRVELG